MGVQEENIDLFEAYLMNRLSKEDCLKFEAKLVYDSDYRLQFDNYKDIGKGIKEHFRTSAKSKFIKVDQELDSKKQSSQGYRKRYYWIGAVAALLVIGIFIVNYSSSQNFEKVSLSYLPHEEGLPVLMGNRGVYDEAMNNYKLKNWDKALSCLDDIQSDTSSYYQGIIFYKLKKYNQSIIEFKQINEESVYHRSAQFRLALAYLASEDVKSSNLMLEELAQINSSYSKEVLNLINELD